MNDVWLWWNRLTETEQERLLKHFYENCKDVVYMDDEVKK